MSNIDSDDGLSKQEREKTFKEFDALISRIAQNDAEFESIFKNLDENIVVALKEYDVQILNTTDDDKNTITEIIKLEELYPLRFDAYKCMNLAFEAGDVNNEDRKKKIVKAVDQLILSGGMEWLKVYLSSASKVDDPIYRGMLRDGIKASTLCDVITEFSKIEPVELDQKSIKLKDENDTIISSYIITTMISIDTLINYCYELYNVFTTDEAKVNPGSTGGRIVSMFGIAVGKGLAHALKMKKLTPDEVTNMFMTFLGNYMAGLEYVDYQQKSLAYCDLLINLWTQTILYSNVDGDGLRKPTVNDMPPNACEWVGFMYNSFNKTGKHIPKLLTKQLFSELNCSELEVIESESINAADQKAATDVINDLTTWFGGAGLKFLKDFFFKPQMDMSSRAVIDHSDFSGVAMKTHMFKLKRETNMWM